MPRAGCGELATFGGNCAQQLHTEVDLCSNKAGSLLVLRGVMGAGMDARAGGSFLAPGSTVYDSCTESEHASSKDNSLRGGGAFSKDGSLRGGSAFYRGRRSREGSQRAGSAFFRRPGDAGGAAPGPHRAEEKLERGHTRSFSSLLAEAAAVLRGAARSGGFPGSPPQQGPPPQRDPPAQRAPPPQSAPARVELQPRSGGASGASGAPAAAGVGTDRQPGQALAEASVSGGFGLGLAPALGADRASGQAAAEAPVTAGLGPRVSLFQASGATPPQPAGAPAADLASPAGSHIPQILLQALPSLTPGTSLSRSEALSSAGTSRVTSLGSIASALTSDPPLGPPCGAWPLVGGVLRDLTSLARSSADTSAAAAAAAASTAQWHQVPPPRPAWWM